MRILISILFILTGTLTFGAPRLRPGESFPQLNLKVIGKDQNLTSAQLQGKVVVVDFWASWCGPCKLSFPFYNTLYKKYHSKGLEIVGVNVDDELKAAQDFQKSTPVDFPLVYDDGKKLVTQVGVATMPTSFFMDRKGKVTLVHRGFVRSDTDKLEKQVQRLLSQK